MFVLSFSVIPLIIRSKLFFSTFYVALAGFPILFLIIALSDVMAGRSEYKHFMDVERARGGCIAAEVGLNVVLGMSFSARRAYL